MVLLKPHKPLGKTVLPKNIIFIFFPSQTLKQVLERKLEEEKTYAAHTHSPPPPRTVGKVYKNCAKHPYFMKMYEH